jgi:hypothetical protein
MGAPAILTTTYGSDGLEVFTGEAALQEASASEWLLK